MLQLVTPHAYNHAMSMGHTITHQKEVCLKVLCTICICKGLPGAWEVIVPPASLPYRSMKPRSRLRMDPATPISTGATAGVRSVIVISIIVVRTQVT